MKNKNILLVMINLIILLIMYNLIKGNINIKNKREILKEMTEIEYDSQITALNQSHTEYSKYFEKYKTKITEAITNQGVETPLDSTAEEVAENIGKILSKRTVTKYSISPYSTTSGAYRKAYFNLTSITNYSDLVLFENFFPVTTSFSANNSGGRSWSYSYNASNGILMVSTDNEVDYSGTTVISNLNIYVIN